MRNKAPKKYLMALLQERDIRFPYSHDLVVLAKLVEPPVSALVELLDELAELNKLAVLVRYPGFDASEPQARGALDLAERVRDACRGAIGLAG